MGRTGWISESLLLLHPSQIAKDLWLHKKLKVSLKRYFKSEPLETQHASFTLILIRCLTLVLVGKNWALLSYYIGFSSSSVIKLCFLSLYHKLTPKSDRQLLFSKIDTKYSCGTMFSSYLIQSASPGSPFPNNSVTVNPPQPWLTKPVFSCQGKANFQYETVHTRSELCSFQKLKAPTMILKWHSFFFFLADIYCLLSDRYYAGDTVVECILSHHHRIYLGKGKAFNKYLHK